jgi:hypothetical protein
MKNMLFAALMAVIATTTASAQIYVNGKELNLDSVAYLEICPVFALENRVRVQVDYGQPNCIGPLTWDRCMLTDSNGKHLRFNSEVATLNFFWHQGWEVQEVFVVSEDQKVYLLRRKK